MKITSLVLASALALSGSMAMAQSSTGGTAQSGTAAGGSSATGGQGTAGSTSGGKMNKDMGRSTTGATSGMTSGSQTPAVDDLSKSSNPGAVEAARGTPGAPGAGTK